MSKAWMLDEYAPVSVFAVICLMPKLGRLTRSRQPIVGSALGFVCWSNSFLGINSKKEEYVCREIRVRVPVAGKGSFEKMLHFLYFLALRKCFLLHQKNKLMWCKAEKKEMLNDS